MNGTTRIISLQTWRDHVHKGGQTFQPRNAFNHLTMAPQDKRGFKLLFSKHSSFRILQWHCLFSCTELVWHAGTEHTLSLENITLFTKTSQFQNSVGACEKEGNWSWFYCWIEVGYYQENILVQCKSDLKESIMGHIKIFTLLHKTCSGQVKIWTLGKTMHVRTGYMLDSNRGSVLRTG